MLIIAFCFYKQAKEKQNVLYKIISLSYNEEMFNDIINGNKNEIKLMSALSLAFVGDAVHSLYVRTILVEDADYKQKDLQAKTSQIVRASNQAKALDLIEPLLTEEETALMTRARNMRTNNKAKNSSAVEYKRSTAFEAIIGYLYLKKDFERMKQFLELTLKTIN